MVNNQIIKMVFLECQRIVLKGYRSIPVDTAVHLNQTFGISALNINNNFGVLIDKLEYKNFRKPKGYNQELVDEILKRAKIFDMAMENALLLTTFGYIRLDEFIQECNNKFCIERVFSILSTNYSDTGKLIIPMSSMRKLVFGYLKEALAGNTLGIEPLDFLYEYTKNLREYKNKPNKLYDIAFKELDTIKEISVELFKSEDLVIKYRNELMLLYPTACKLNYKYPQWVLDRLLFSADPLVKNAVYSSNTFYNTLDVNLSIK